MRKWNLIIGILLFVLAALCYVFFDLRPIEIIHDDPIANKLLCSFISHAGLSLFFGWMFYLYGGYKFMIFSRDFFKSLLWCLPCFMVAIINFPISALIQGTAKVVRTDLLGLYALYILGIAILEEIIFRGTLFIIVSDYLRRSRHRYLFTALICAGIFSLFHLTNLLVGMSVGTVLLQCLYTFLIGGMLIVTMMKTKNIWLCTLIHFLFDFGGLLIIQIGAGSAWDTVFWILTFVGGALCAGHIVFSLIKLDKDYVS